MVSTVRCCEATDAYITVSPLGGAPGAFLSDSTLGKGAEPLLRSECWTPQSNCSCLCQPTLFWGSLPLLAHRGLEVGRVADLQATAARALPEPSADSGSRYQVVMLLFIYFMATQKCTDWNRIYEDRSRLVVAWREGGGWGVTANGDELSFGGWGGMRMF